MTELGHMVQQRTPDAQYQQTPNQVQHGCFLHLLKLAAITV